MPEVRPNIGPHVAFDGPVDFSDCAGRPSDFILLSNGSDAATLNVLHGPAVVDMHMIFAPSCRGRKAIDTCSAMFDWIFQNTKAQIITGSPPKHFRAVRWFARKLGMTSDGIHLVTNEHWTMDHEWFHMTRDNWVRLHK